MKDKYPSIAFSKNWTSKQKPSKEPKRNRTVNKLWNFLQRQKDRPFESTDYLKISTGLGQDSSLLFLFAQKHIDSTDNCSTCSLIHESEEITKKPY